MNRHLIFQFEIMCQNYPSHVEKSYWQQTNLHVFLQKRNILLNFLVFFIFLTFPWKISWYSYSTYFLQNWCNGQMMCTEYYSCKYVDKDWWNICTYILLNRYTYLFLAEKYNCHLHRTKYSIINDLYGLHILAPEIFM